MVDYNIDYFDLLSAESFYVKDVGYFKMPTLKEIKRLGYNQYHFYLSTLFMNKQDILKIYGLEDQYDKLSQEAQEQICVFDQLTVNQNDREGLLNILSFFICGEIIFNEDLWCFIIDGDGVINRDNFEQIKKLILKINHCGVSDELNEEKYTNEKARKIAEKFKKAKQEISQRNKNDDITIPNVISALSTHHHSLNIINIWDLTIYQLFDQFCRQDIKNQLDMLSMNCATQGGEFKANDWYKSINKT